LGWLGAKRKEKYRGGRSEFFIDAMVVARAVRPSVTGANRNRQPVFGDVLVMHWWQKRVSALATSSTCDFGFFGDSGFRQTENSIGRGGEGRASGSSSAAALISISLV